MNNNVFNSIILFIAQGAYSGRVRFAPGTAGTLVGVLLYFLIMGLSPMRYLALCLLIAIIGTWIAGKAEKQLGQTDAPSIVIDEIAGFLITMFMLPPSWGFIIAGFLLFRFFDILKPWPLKRLQDLHGGVGIMLDDIGAGIYANIVLQIALIFLLHS
jgi:phosphatidylglycerophosphatase A